MQGLGFRVYKGSRRVQGLEFRVYTGSRRVAGLRIPDHRKDLQNRSP